MDRMPLNFVVLCEIPEAIILIFAGLYLLGIKPSFKRVIIGGILQGIASALIGRYIGYGEEYIYKTITMMIIICTIFRINPICGLLSSLIGTALSILVEAAYILLVLQVSSYTYAEILSRDWLRVIFTIPKHIILVFIIGIFMKNHYTLDEEFKFLAKITG